AREPAHLAGCDRVADGKSRRELLTLAVQLVGLQRADLLARLHGLGPGLHDIELARLAVLRPFDVHRLAVVRFNRAGPAGELDDLLVVEHERVALTPRRADELGGRLAAARIDHLLRLPAERLFD